MSGTVSTLQGTDATRYPYNAIVKITDTIGGTTFQSTGVLISPDEVLTADSAVYKSGTINGGSGVASSVTATLTANDGSTGVITSTDYAGAVTHYTPITDFPPINYTDVQSDYAIIHLSKPVIGGTKMALHADFTGGQAHVTGFPAAANGALVDETALVEPVKGYSILEAPSLGGGSSGAPIWNLGADKTPDLYGLTTASQSSIGGTAFGPLFTTADVAQINAWVATDDNLPTPPSDFTPSLPGYVPPSTTPDLTLGITLAPGLARQSPVSLTAVVPKPATPPSTAPAVPAPPPAPVNPPAVMSDGGTGAQMPCPVQPYAGPVGGLLQQIISITTQNLNILASAPGLFIHTGSGNDAIQALSGINVLDGGTGSNFLTAGTGFDTFFVDSRGATSDTWSTLANFHASDAATLWGVSPTSAALNWSDGGGAAGYTGLTLHATAAGKPTASITLAGFSMADMASGKLSTSFGHDAASGSDYLYVHAT